MFDLLARLAHRDLREGAPLTIERSNTKGQVKKLGICSRCNTAKWLRADGKVPRHTLLRAPWASHGHTQPPCPGSRMFPLGIRGIG